MNETTIEDEQESKGRCRCGMAGCSDAAYWRGAGTGAVAAHEEHPGGDDL